MNKLDVLEQYIREYYYEPEDIKEETLENGMYKGLMSSLGDPYTEYYTKDEYKFIKESVLISACRRGQEPPCSPVSCPEHRRRKPD